MSCHHCQITANYGGASFVNVQTNYRCKFKRIRLNIALQTEEEIDQTVSYVKDYQNVDRSATSQRKDQNTKGNTSLTERKYYKNKLKIMWMQSRDKFSSVVQELKQNLNDI